MSKRSDRLEEIRAQIKVFAAENKKRIMSEDPDWTDEMYEEYQDKLKAKIKQDQLDKEEDYKKRKSEGDLTEVESQELLIEDSLKMHPNHYIESLKLENQELRFMVLNYVMDNLDFQEPSYKGILLAFREELIKLRELNESDNPVKLNFNEVYDFVHRNHLEMIRDKKIKTILK